MTAWETRPLTVSGSGTGRVGCAESRGSISFLSRVVRYLRELASTWRKAEGGSGRRTLAEARSERIEALGFREATLRLTDAAISHGFAAVTPERLELTAWLWSGREE